jgi:hypothetical protein
MQITIDITPDPSKLAAAYAQAPALVAREQEGAMEASLLHLHGEVARRTPVDRGILRGSIFTALSGTPLDLRGKVASPLEYAVPVEEGTRPHIIRPRSGRYLRFVANGRVVFARQVQHPGTRGVHMFAEGLRAARPRIEALFERAADRIAAALARAG